MKVTYERFCFPITLRCNLRCKLCAEYSPYYEKPYHPAFKELAKQLDGLFELVERIDKFDITGGETFLRKDLPEILLYIYNNFRTKIGNVRVTTNGTLLPPDGFTESAVLWGNDIYVIVDNYSVSDKSGIVAEILEEAGIPCELRDYSAKLHCDGWVDYGDLTLKHSRKEAMKLFEKCLVPKLGFFSCMVNGYVFPCARARLLFEHDISDVSACILDEKMSLNGKKVRLNDLLGNEVVEACRYCNGLCEDSQRFIPAEQLEMNLKQAQKKIEYESWQLKYGKMLFYTQTYNNEKTIARTIESVLNSTNTDYTYFIFNNGSTDNTGDIIKQYASDNPHIVYEECERNDILAATLIPFHFFAYVPEYLNNYYCIVDGDDTIEPNFLEKVMVLLSRHNADMVVPSYKRVNAESGAVINQRCLEEDTVVSDRQKADNFINFRPLLLCQWGKVYRWKTFKKESNFFLEPYYLKMPKWFHQLDTVGVLSIFYQTKKVAFIAEPIYNYYVSEKSTYGSYLPNRIQNDVLMFRIYNDFLEKFEPVSKVNRDYCYAIYLSLLYENLNSIIHTDAISQECKLSEILEILCAKETRQMLTGKFDPIFSNLSHREEFLITIRKYLKSLPQDVQCRECAGKINNELNKYSYAANSGSEEL